MCKLGKIGCLFVFAAVALIATPQTAQASNITLQGLFTHDDNVQLFNLTIAAAGTVDIRSYGYAGGTASTGTVVPSGGFDTILTLFDGSGTFLADNDDGAGAAIDPATGLAADARITTNLAAGSYIVALTQYDNFSAGNLADGFIETGNPNFTADPAFTTGGPCASNMFRDISGTAGRCRNGNWTVDFVNVASVTPVAVPEPGTIALLGAGLLAFALLRTKRRMAAGLAVLAAMCSVGAKAQNDPDYTNVGDILNGNRTLLAVDDLVINGYVNNASPRLPDFYTFSMTTSNSQLSTGRAIDIGAFAIPSSGPPTLTGHIFNSSAATTVVLRSDQPDECELYLPLENALCDPGLNNAVPVAGAVADFNQDGYGEIVYAGQNVLALASAADVNNSQNNPAFNYGPTTPVDGLTDVITGDFNGDGQPEIAALLSLPSGGLALAIYTVDPKTLAISKAAQITLQQLGSESMAARSIASGRFTAQAHDQIIVASTPNNVTRTTLELIDFAPSSLTPQEKTSYAFGSGFLPGMGISGLIRVKSGKFGLPANQYDQVAFLFAWIGNPRAPGGHTKYINVLSIDPATSAWTPSSFYDFSDQDCGFDIAVGNFDHRQPDPANPGKTQPNLNDQIALVYGSCGNGTKSANIINLDPTTFASSVASSTALDSRLNPAAALSFSQSDTQGRSMLLGEPTKVTITTLDQPTVIAAAPPMHIDFVKPLDGSPDGNTTQVLDLSAMPLSYYTQYQVDNSGSSQSSHTSTTGTGWSAKESVNLKVQFGNPNVDPVSGSADIGFAASQAKKEIDTNGSNNFSSHSFDVSVQTNGSDQVWYTENDLNIWIYPVIGKTTCPAGKTCPPAAQVPLNIQFSAPNPTVLASRAGNILNWYQPPWEPGNVFSYPANYSQLQAEIPVSLDKLSEDTSFSTDSLIETIKANWASGSGTSQSTNSTRTYTEEGSLTTSGKVNLFGVSAQLTGSVTAGGSQSFSDLHTSQTTMGSSTGVGIHKPGGFANPGLYNYSVVPYILGQQKPAQDDSNNPPATGIDTFGTIRTVFTVDPTATSAGSWWQTMYGQRPDVALNHPYRWVSSRSLIATPTPRNCRVDGEDMSCFTQSTRIPSDPVSSEFHWLRGFFITDATNAGQGPQVEVAHAGDKLSLQTRVYNYSLKAMDPGTTVQVRFYVQPWNSGTNMPQGSSVLIGKSALDPIPPFNSTEGAPLNWVFASTTFDTTPYAGQYLTFWVVVWMQDGNEHLVPDLEGHGLTSIPENVASLADVQEEAYSNNVGFYDSKIYVLPPGDTSAGLGSESSSNPGDGHKPARTAVNIGKIGVSGTPTIAPGPAVKVSATLRAGSVPADTTTVWFYDGDPNAGGKEFSAERVPYIPADGTFMVGAPYRAQTCGKHDLFIVVNQGTASEVVRRASPVHIPCASHGRFHRQ